MYKDIKYYCIISCPLWWPWLQKYAKLNYTISLFIKKKYIRNTFSSRESFLGLSNNKKVRRPRKFAKVLWGVLSELLNPLLQSGVEEWQGESDKTSQWQAVFSGLQNVCGRRAAPHVKFSILRREKSGVERG